MLESLRSGLLLVVLSCLLSALVVVRLQGATVERVVKDAAQSMAPNNPDGRRPIFESELKLRSVIEATNLELRELKRDFMRHMSNVYLPVKRDHTVGVKLADGPPEAPRREVAAANTLLAAEFAEVVIKKHMIQRRLLTGLKLAFVKLLPMQTLLILYRRYKSFEWLKDQQQVDLRPKFPEAKEKHFNILYSLIELRARVRAADDVFALTSDHQQRALQIAQWYLVDSNHGADVTGPELDALATNARLVLAYYQEEVLKWREKLHQQYEAFLASAKPLEAMLGGREALVEFIDRLVNVEALDIDLNEEARSLEVPPTISEEMIANVAKSWIPIYVLNSLEEDRKLIVANRKQVLPLVRLDPAYEGADLPEWTSNMISYIVCNRVHYLAR